MFGWVSTRLQTGISIGHISAHLSGNIILVHLCSSISLERRSNMFQNLSPPQLLLLLLLFSFNIFHKHATMVRIKLDCIYSSWWHDLNLQMRVKFTSNWTRDLTSSRPQFSPPQLRFYTIVIRSAIWCYTCFCEDLFLCMGNQMVTEIILYENYPKHLLKLFVFHLKQIRHEEKTHQKRPRN